MLLAEALAWVIPDSGGGYLTMRLLDPYHTRRRSGGKEKKVPREGEIHKNWPRWEQPTHPMVLPTLRPKKSGSRVALPWHARVFWTYRESRARCLDLPRRLPQHRRLWEAQEPAPLWVPVLLAVQSHSSEERRRCPPPPPQGRQLELAKAARHTAALLAGRREGRGEKREEGEKDDCPSPALINHPADQMSPLCTPGGDVPAHKGACSSSLTSAAEHCSCLSAPLYWNCARLLQLLPCAAHHPMSSEIRMILVWYNIWGDPKTPWWKLLISEKAVNNLSWTPSCNTAASHN